KKHQSLLINLRQSVNGFPAYGGVLRRGRAFGDGIANWTMYRPVAFSQLFNRSNLWENQAVLRTNPGAFAVNSLRTRDDYFFCRQVFLANHLEHLRGPK